ncbi:MAG: PadR family transcriptional regulator [Coriobacteriia bacterium]|jgi:DNA-binding PadR family transcriptional regulator|nr:PadR family transcriptional regulator [Coriobacteriia bacterium]
MHGPGRPCCRRGGGGGGGAFVEPAALAALARSGGHGYDLRREISELTDGAFDVDAGGLYRVLRRLEEEGFVSSRWAEGDSGPQRRDYELTPEGRDLAHDWIEHLRERERVSSVLAGALASSLKKGGSTHGKRREG